MVTDLIEQTIAQHIIAPKVLSYAPSKLNEVTGRFVSANRVYNFVLNKQGVSYSPAGQGDSLLFSALYLVRMPSVSLKLATTNVMQDARISVERFV